MTGSVGDDALQRQLLELVFANGLTPQQACDQAFPDHPNRKALDVVFLITLIATDLKSSFRAESHWTYTDWLEAATSLACDVYAASRLNAPDPSLGDIATLWSDTPSQSRAPDEED
ncbi:hypothetical protein [Shimia ponticola]|uniref:hypothetical protein n=1 Tax=Shimia ponticola TaxID=2582893 RepID=UPI0011BEA4D0|nr:hypothetical protein [Shimia ponticola]